MILTLIAKNATAKTGNQFIVYSCNRHGKWYDVRFAQVCPKPTNAEHIAVSEKAHRVFIDIESDSITLTQRNGRDVIYVSKYTPVTGDKLAAIIAAEKQKIDAYIKQKDQLKRDFFATESEPPIDKTPSALALQDDVPSPDDDDMPF